MARDWEDRGRYNRGRNHGTSDHGRSDRDWSAQAGDEMRSWFGDDDAERRRREDERRSNVDYTRIYSHRADDPDDDRGSDRDTRYGNDRPQPSGGSYGGGGGGYAGGGYAAAGGYGGGGGRSSTNDADRSSYRASSFNRPDAGYGENTHYGNDRPSYSSGDRSEDRGFFERAGDEVSSGLGDDDAQRRRDRDAGHRGRGPKNYVRSDERIREDVNDRLSDDRHLDASDIDVTVKDGEVTLNGTVNERMAKRHAEDLVEHVSGVKHVQNNLRVNTQGANYGTSGTGTGSSSPSDTGTGNTGS